MSKVKNGVIYGYFTDRTYYATSLELLKDRLYGVEPFDPSNAYQFHMTGSIFGKDNVITQSKIGSINECLFVYCINQSSYFVCSYDGHWKHSDDRDYSEILKALKRTIRNTRPHKNVPRKPFTDKPKEKREYLGNQGIANYQI